MGLLIETPPTREPERSYILDAVVGDRLGLPWRRRSTDRTDVRITLEGDASRTEVLLPDGLFATPPAQWLAPDSLPRAPVAWSDGPGGRVPVLFGTPDSVDLLGGCFFALTRYEELAAPATDVYGRFPASASIAARAGFLRMPVADAYVERLWEALARAWPRLERRVAAYRVELTHDVDDPLASLGRDTRARARQLAADALVRRDAALVARRLRSWAAARRGDHRGDPYNTFDVLMAAAERHGIAGVFNFLATERAGPPEGSYTLNDPWVLALLRRLHERGHEVGFHAGFHTMTDARRTAEEFARLRSTAERHGVVQKRWGGRQHYLRWRNPVTWANWEQAGLDYDSTVGFPDAIGFRAGTCHDYRAFDLLKRRPLQLREHPLHVMDITLTQYLRLSPEAALAAVAEVARECRRHNGTLRLLWHNSSLPSARQQRWYQALVDTVAGRP